MRIFNDLRLSIIMGLCPSFVAVAAHAEVNCASHVDTSRDVVWRPVRDGVQRLHFLAPTSPDHPECPGGDRCELPAFLTGGDQVIATTTGYEPVHKKGLICGVYISPKGTMTFGWLDADGFYGGGSVMSEFSVPQISGTWTDRMGAEIAIRLGEDGSYARVEGKIALGRRDGSFSGPAFIGPEAAGYDSTRYDGRSPAGSYKPDAAANGCRVRFRYTGYYLLVDDNDGCGGQGVSFNGVYIKRSVKK